jgi:hypothetical protein
MSKGTFDITPLDFDYSIIEKVTTDTRAIVGRDVESDAVHKPDINELLQLIPT